MKILVVEDEQRILDGIITIIKNNINFACKIIGKSNGLDALETAREFKPHLVITDIIMPKMTGLELVENIKKEDLCDNLIILSGHDNFSFAQTAIRFGVVDYILKPIEKPQLLRSIEKVYNSLPKSYFDEEEKKLPEIPFFDWKLDLATSPSSLQKIVEYVNNNYMNDISLQDISEQLLLHPSYISTLISKYIGQSFVYLLNYVRIKKAAELLIYQPNTSISEVSHFAGYINERRLYNAFQKYLQTTPGCFRNNYINNI